MIVVVTGGRDFQDEALVESTLDSIPNVERIFVGGCRGADELAKQWAQARGVPVTVVPADWQTHGRAAGPIRNRQMLREAKALGECILAAFPGGRGTSHCIDTAREIGIHALIASEEA